MANILIFNEVDGTVLDYLPSVDTGQYLNRTDVLIHPDLTAVAGYDKKYWEVSAGLVVLKSQSERDAIDQAEADAQELAIRTAAKAPMDDFSVDGLVLRAFADVVRDEINILRNQHSLPERTLLQLKNAIKGKIDAKTVD